MLRASLFSAFVVLASGGLAQAADLTANPPTQTVVCLDVSGATLPVVCKAEGSRLDQREDICLCPQGQRVDIAVCGPNERPPAESLAYDVARHKAIKKGSLLGASFEGQRMCVAPRNSR